MIWNANFGRLSGNDSHTYGFEKLNFATVLQLVREKSANLPTTPIKCIANCKPIFFSEIQMGKQEWWRKPCFDGKGDLGGQTSVLIGHSGFWLRANYKILSSTKPRKDCRTSQKHLFLYSWDIKLMSEFLGAHLSPSEFKISGSVWFCWNT